MRNVIPILLALAAVAAMHPPAAANVPPPPAEKTVREILVPFEDLNVLLEGDPNRVLLSRQEYQALLEKAKQEAERRPPQSALVVSADYAAKVGEERAEIAATLVLNVLEDGLHAVGLDMAGVGLRGATLDEKPAPLGLADDGRLTLFVQGKGRHALALDMVAPLQTTAARQVLNFRLPAPAAARLHLTVPGDVEVKSGAPVVSRTFDAAAGETRIELLPQRGDTSLVMTLNSRLLRRDRVVVARSVLVDEVTGGYERLHATVSMAVLHRAVGSFRFTVPEGFDVTDVRSPLLARWAIVKEGGRSILDVQLREETTETVVLNLSASRAAPGLDQWAFPKLEPLDVAGQVALVCLTVEDRLKAEAVAPTGLVPIDTTVLAQALPATVLEAAPGAARIRPVVAYYAPQGTFDLTARFVRPPAVLRVVTNLLAVMEDGGLTVLGGFALWPEEEKRFAFDFSVPAGWDVTAVTGDDGKPIPFERYGAAGQAGRVHVRLPSGVPAGTVRQVLFTAVHVPKTWFDDWETTGLDFPVFAVAGASRDEGAVAVDARDDMIVRPEALEGLTPLDETEKARYGLQGRAANLAYRYDGQPYRARLAVERTRPRITAQTFSFFRVERDALAAHYEIVYDVSQARTRRLSLVLPADTPTALAIRGLDGVALKEYTSELIGQGDQQRRRWTAILAEPRSGPVRLAVDFEQRLATLEPKDLALPVVEAAAVAYQSGLVAVEGSPELDVRVTEHPRKVDIGELVDAEYQPGRRLLGAFGFVGAPAPVRASVARHPACDLPPAIVQRAELATAMSADGVAQTAARFLLKTKALFLEVRLPEGSTLWSATLDGEPVKPQREAESLLLNLPAAGAGAVRDLHVVFETSIGSLGFWRGVGVVAPRLYLHASAEAAGEEVPVADLLWHLYLPPAYRVIRAEGSVVTRQVAPPPLAVASVAGALYHGTGGVDFRHGAIGLILTTGAGAMRHAVPAASRARGRAAGTAEHFYFGAEEADEEAAMDESRPAGPAGEKPEGRPALEQSAKEAETATGMLAFRNGATVTLNGLARTESGAETGTPADGPAPAETPAVPAAGGEPKVPLEITVPKPMFQGAPKALPPGYVAAGKDGEVVLVEPGKPPVPPTKTKAPADKRKAIWALEGVSSLKIDLVATGEPVTFQSLGTEPRLELTVVDDRRVTLLALALALGTFVAGLALTTRTVGRKTAYVVAACLVATLIPVVTARIELAMVVNGAFYAACLLVPYYLVAGLLRWLAAKVRGIFAKPVPTAAAMLLAVAAALVLVGAASAAEKAADPAAPYIIQVVPPPAPVKVPPDAILLPYDPALKTGIQEADRLLVPYEKFVELWNQAYPDKPIGTKEPPAPYATAGASFTASLAGEEYLLVEGRVQVDVFTDEYAMVPLPLEGGVLAKADLDGKPARLSVAGVDPKSLQGKNVKDVPKRAFIVVYVAGKGRHTLDVAVRLRLTRQGGWRVAEGRLPAAPATGLVLRVPDAGTEVRLTGVPDRQSYETKAAGETVRTALGASGEFGVQWRPKVSEGQVDQTLTADSSAVLDVQEDSLRLVWTLGLEFRHGERDFFTVEVPAGYTVEKVEGTNVRGWELKAAGQGQELTVTLLKRAKGSERFSVTIWRPAGKADAGAFDVPVLGVSGAARHTGQFVIRRSPLLDLRTVSTSGVTRADLPPEPKRGPGKPADVESPLGIRPYQAYRFVATPFTVRLTAAPILAKASAAVQMILRVAERERSLEARAMLHVEGRPLYLARFVVPADLKLERVVAPGTFEWALTDEGGGRTVLTVYLASGVEGDCPIVLQGKLGEQRQTLQAAVPHLEVLDVDRQEGDIVIQADPAFDVRVEGLQNIERVLLNRVFGWLSDEQKALAQVALHYARPDYAGALRLEARKSDVTCFTVTNARVTDRAIEETVLVTWTIRNAGIREVSFLLPAWMKDARIQVPLLRQKTVTAVTPDDPASPLRVRLELQDEVMDELRVLVEHDRLLAEGVHEAPIPVVETGRTDRRYVAVESAGRDEVIVEKQEGLEPLGRQQKEWAAVAGMLRGGVTQAFIVSPGAEQPVLGFRTQQRVVVETVEGRIGLAQATLVLDASGAYRARQVYRVDNRTEQFLEIQLPEGAALWTAVVAGEPVKPTQVEDPAKARHVRIPIVKTAPGDLDYEVVLKYGGRLDSLPAFAWSVRFPLIRTVNINVELTQVQVYLPETHAWFDFGGPMSLAAEEGVLKAGILSYQNKQADRLIQTLRSDNPFAQARALSNLTDIAGKIQAYRMELGDEYAANKEVQAELSNAQVILQSAEEEIKSQAQAPQGQFDNNDLIREAYSGQHNRRARNLVQDVGANWKETPPAAVQPPPGQERFNDAWLSSNRLQTGPLADQKQQAQRRDIQFDQGGRGQQAVQQAQPQAAASQMFEKLREAGKKSGTAAGEEQAGQRLEMQQRRGAEDVVARYQQRLEQREKMDRQVAEPVDTATTLAIEGHGGGRAGGFAAWGAGGRAATAGPAREPTGMASLDVELPVRGRRYQFSMPMPRADVEITARSASVPLVEGLKRMAGVAVLVLAVLALRRLAKGRSFDLRAQSMLSTVLLVLGLAGLGLGVFPVAGLVAVLAGVAMKVRLFFARRRPAAAA